MVAWTRVLTGEAGKMHCILDACTANRSVDLLWNGKEKEGSRMTKIFFTSPA
jgi:hypothetical protein